MKNLTTFLFGALLVTCFATDAMAVRYKYPPGPPYRSCGDTLSLTDPHPTIFDIEQSDTTLAPCHPATLDTVWDVRGIITGFDAKPSAFGFYIQNTFSTGEKPWTGVDVFTGASNYNSSVPGTPTGGNLALGDSVVIYGTTNEFNGLTEIEGPDTQQGTNDIIIRKIVGGIALPPVHIGTTVDFDWVPAISAATAEPWEGCLVKINGPLKVARVQTGAGVAPGHFLVVDPGAPGDSVDVDGTTLTTYGAPPLNTTIGFVQGILNQGTPLAAFGALNSYRIQLRNDGDIFDASTPPTLTDAYPIEDNILRLTFDRKLDPSTAQTPGNYTLGSQLSGSTVNTAALETNPGSVVRLNITSALTDGERETVNAVGIGSANCPSCVISPGQTRNFVNGVMAITDVQKPDPAFLPLFQDRSRFAGVGTTPGIRLSFRGISVVNYGSLYYLEDLAGGPRSGVSIFGPGTALTAGHKYLVAGAVQEFGSETEVVNTVYIVDEGTGPAPLFATTPDLETVHVLSDTTTDMDGTHSTGEDFEGMLVRIENVKSTLTVNAAGDSFFVAQPYPGDQDTMLIFNSASKFTYQAVKYQNFDFIQGVLHQDDRFPHTYRILPRNNADIQANGFVSVDESAPRTLSLSIAPNPARTARVTFAVPKRSEVNLAVFDLQGREVALIAKGVFEPGSYTRAWNGKDRSGRKLGSGMFFYRLKVGDRVLKARSVIIAN